MTTFLYHRARAGIELAGYNSTAEGQLMYDEQGPPFSDIKVRPQVVVASEAARGQAESALERSERTWVISNALRCPVTVGGTVEMASGGEA